MDTNTRENGKKYLNHYAIYTEKSKNICLYTAVSLLLILLFVVSPINQFAMVSLIGKIGILFILAYTLYSNYILTRDFNTNTKTSFTKGKWSSQKTNIICSYIFSFFILLLFLSIIRTLFI